MARKKKLDSLIIVDIESTCWDGTPPPGEVSEIIEIGVCSIDMNKLKVSTAKSILIKPELSNVSKFCTQLTTITPELASTGTTFLNGCNQLVQEYNSNQCTWASWGDYDRKQFQKQCAMSKYAHVQYPFGSTHINLKNLFSLCLGLSKELGMAEALEMLGLPLIGVHHRAASDAQNIATIATHLFALIRK